MPRKKRAQPTQTLGWQAYVALLRQQRESLIRDYGQQRSGFGGMWGQRNDQRVNEAQLDQAPIAQAEEDLRKHDARNRVSRFFIRVFTRIEKKRALLHYHHTLNVLNELINQPAPLEKSRVDEYFLQLAQQPSANLSGISRLSSFMKRLKKTLRKVILLPSPVPQPGSSTQADIPVPEAPSSHSASPPVSPAGHGASFFQTSARATSPKVVSIASNSTADEAMLQKDFQEGFEQEKRAFADKIKEINQDFYNQLHRNNDREQAFEGAQRALKKTYLQLCRRYHPDKVSQELKAMAAKNTDIKTLIDDSFKTLLNMYGEALKQLGQGAYANSDGSISPEDAAWVEKFSAEVDDMLRNLRNLEQEFEEFKKANREWHKKFDAIVLVLKTETIKLVEGIEHLDGLILTIKKDTRIIAEDNKRNKQVAEEILRGSERVLETCAVANQRVAEANQQADVLEQQLDFVRQFIEEECRKNPSLLQNGIVGALPEETQGSMASPVRAISM